MNIVENYIAGLKKAYFDNGDKEAWEHFEKIKYGANKEDIAKLKEIYPDTPKALINLLEYVDGTYYREYEGEKITFYFLGSDIEGYPYYLLSSKAIIEHKKIDIFYCDEVFFYDKINTLSEYEKTIGVSIDDRITNKADNLKWLHFSDCMNNGGTSQLFIDFSPSKKGKVGQIVRFLHDPDEFAVIADSFEDYLKMLIDNNYDFIDGS